jgi:hypothetical protein
MLKVLYFVALVALVALLACGGEDATEAPAAMAEPAAAPTAMPEPTAVPTAMAEPTAAPTVIAEPTAAATAMAEPTTAPTAMAEPTAVPEPTDTPTPTATPEPTAMTEPTATTEPTAMPEPENEPGAGGIAPLQMDDPVAMMSQFSESELACVAGTAETDRLLQLFASPDLASPEEQTQLIGCMEDETVLRLFLTGFIGGTGSLSEETSDCIRSGMEGVDLRSVMLAGTAGDEQAAMVGGMSALFLTVGCLNEEEFEVAAPALGMSPADRESQMCAIEKLGGPEGIAALMESGDEAVFMSLIGAAIECGVQMEGSAPGG